MKSFACYILLFFVLSCKSKITEPLPKNPQKSLIIEKKISQKKISTDEIFGINYNITDLKNYKDTTQFIGRIMVTKRFNKILVIELTQFVNAVSLCVKQPSGYPYDENIDCSHSKPFNQLCYYYFEEEGNRLKESFAKYNTGQIRSDTVCKGCLDPQVYKIEVFDHGKYSSLDGDIISKENFNFVSYLMKKVNVNYKDFKIR